MQRDKVSLDITWLRDESLEDMDNLPPPEVIAQEIVEDLEAALAEFAAIAYPQSPRFPVRRQSGSPRRLARSSALAGPDCPGCQQHRIELTFDEALRAAIETKPPDKKPTQTTKKLAEAEVGRRV